MRALVIADGAAPSRAALDAAWPGWDSPIDLVIAADGGARLAAALGLPIDRWVGDGDSLGPTGMADLRRQGIAVDPAPTAKDESDTELALLAAIEAGATEIALLGVLGGARPDHALANIALLGHPLLAGRTAVIIDPTARITLLAAGMDVALVGRVGDIVSLLTLERVTGVTTTGLLYPLVDGVLDAGRVRGLSNVRTAEVATVAIRGGRLLVVEAPATLTA
jgi:thiamine pyrophosphokinase